MYVARVWHYVQRGVPPPLNNNGGSGGGAGGADGALLPPPARAAMHTRGDSSWYATRVRTKARHLLAQLLDLRRLRAAIAAAAGGAAEAGAAASAAADAADSGTAAGAAAGTDAGGGGGFRAPAVHQKLARPALRGLAREWGPEEDTVSY